METNLPTPKTARVKLLIYGGYPLKQPLAQGDTSHFRREFTPRRLKRYPPVWLQQTARNPWLETRRKTPRQRCEAAGARRFEPITVVMILMIYYQNDWNSSPNCMPRAFPAKMSFIRAIYLDLSVSSSAKCSRQTWKITCWKCSQNKTHLERKQLVHRICFHESNSCLDLSSVCLWVCFLFVHQQKQGPLTSP